MDEEETKEALARLRGELLVQLVEACEVEDWRYVRFSDLNEPGYDGPDERVMRGEAGKLTVTYMLLKDGNPYIDPETHLYAQETKEYRVVFPENWPPTSGVRRQ